MRQFSSPRVSGLEFTMYEDGSGGAEYKGKKIGSVDLQTKEIKFEGDTWTPYPYESRILDMFIEQAEDYAIKNLNAEKHFCAEIDNIYVQPVAEGTPNLQIYLKNIREDDVFEYIERSKLLSAENFSTNYSSINELMYSTKNYNSGLGEEAPTLSISLELDKNDNPEMYIVFEDGEGYPYAEVPLNDKEKAEINAFVNKELGCLASECLDEKKFENVLRDAPYDETTTFFHELSKLDEYDDKFAADRRYADLLLNIVKSAKLNKAAAAELLLNADMITIAELSPYFKEDKKAAIMLDETTAEFLINKSPELKQAFEDKGYDNYKSFFENNRGEAYIEANDSSNIGITVVITDKEYPIPLSPAEKNTLRDRLDEEIIRRNKEDLEDKDGDHIPDRIDSNFSPDGYKTQTDINYNKNTDDDYRKALVTSEEYNELKSKGFECQKAKTVHEDGRIPIRFHAAEKEKFEKIVNALGGKNGGIHI